MSTTVNGEMLRAYFQTLKRVAEDSAHLVRSVARSHGECEWIVGLWGALSCTFQALSLMSATRNIGTYADTSASGLPNNMVIELLDQLKRDAKKQLDVIMPIDALKHRWLEALCTSPIESNTLLATMRERYAFEYLGKHDVLSACTLGPILEVTTASVGRRAYLISWSGYDPYRLIPFVYGALVEQDVSAEPLTSNSRTRKELSDFVRNEGYYRETGIMGALIDDRIDWLHPKSIHSFALRRVITHDTLGTDDWSLSLQQFDTSKDGYIAFVRHEIARSHGESPLPNTKETRERWLSPPGASELQSTFVFERDDRIITSHAVAQHMSGRLRADAARIITIEELRE